MENKLNLFLISVSDFDVLSVLFCLKQVEYKVIVKEAHCPEHPLGQKNTSSE